MQESANDFTLLFIADLTIYDNDYGIYNGFDTAYPTDCGPKKKEERVINY